MAKMSQQEANYRPGTPLQHCGICIHYGDHSCEIVEGEISPFALTDPYVAEKNPFRARPGAPAANGAPADQAPPPPSEGEEANGSLRIGNKSY